MSKCTILSIVIVLVVSVKASYGQLEYDFILLDTFGGSYGYAQGINESGQVVGYASDASVLDHAFLYENGIMMDLGTLGGTEGWAYAINDNGLISGSSRFGTGEKRATLWEDSSVIDLGNLGGSRNLPDDVAWDINNNRQIVGQVYADPTGNPIRGFSWEDGSMEDLGTLISGSTDRFSQAYGINAQGQIVGQSESTSGNSAFIYDGGMMFEISASSNKALDINDSSQIVGSYSTDQGFTHAFLYDYVNDAFTGLGTLGGISSGAQALNENGDVVGAAYTSEGEIHAYLYTNSTMVDLNSLLPENSPWDYLHDAKDINESGQIVGIGIIDGNVRGFVATPIPEPATLSLLALGGLALRGRWWHNL